MKRNKKYSKLSKIFDFRLFLYDLAKWSAAFPGVLIIRLKLIFASEKAKKFRRETSIYVSNHFGFSDPFILFKLTLYRRLIFIVSDLFVKRKFLNFFFFKCCRMIPISRENVSMKTFKTSVNELKRGHNICIFPEGRIVKDQESDFKAGAVMMAHMANVPIQPVYIEPVKFSIFRRKKVVIGDKIYLNQIIKNKIPTMEDIELATKYLHDVQKELKKKLEQVKQSSRKEK